MTERAVVIDRHVDVAEPGHVAKRIDGHQHVGGAQNSERRT